MQISIPHPDTNTIHLAANQDQTIRAHQKALQKEAMGATISIDHPIIMININHLIIVNLLIMIRRDLGSRMAAVIAIEIPRRGKL